MCAGTSSDWSINVIVARRLGIGKVALAIALIAAAAPLGRAGGVPAIAAPAEVSSDVECWVVDGNGIRVEATAVHEVVRQGNNGGAILRCSLKSGGNAAGGSGARAQQVSPDAAGLVCTIPGAEATTTNWRAVVSASGNVTLICRLP